MPEVPLAGEVIREMKSRPYTMVLILGLAVAVPYLWEATARADDVKALVRQVQGISASLLEAKLRAINSELFDVRQRIADKQAAHQSVDQLYFDRVSALESDKAQTERELALLAKGQ